MNIKPPQKLYDFDEKWNSYLQELSHKLKDVDFRIDELSICDDFAILGCAGFSLFNAVDLYKKLVDLHHEYNGDKEIQAYRAAQKRFVDKQLNEIFKK